MIITISSLNLYNTCAPKYYFRHERGLVRTGIFEEALEIGSAFHSGMEGETVAAGLDRVEDYFARLASAITPDAWFKIDEMRAKSRAMIRRAKERWPEMPKYVEKEFEVGIADGVQFCGKVDRINEHCLDDYKTAANVIQSASDSLMKWQLPGYAWGLNRRGHNIDTLNYRFIAKPQVKRYKPGKKRKEPETVEAYESRCYEAIKDCPTHEEEVFLHDGKLDAFERYMLSTLALIMSSKQSGAWPCNQSACKNYNRDCVYRPLCQQVANGTALEDIRIDGFEDKRVHAELEEKEGQDGGGKHDGNNDN